MQLRRPWLGVFLSLVVSCSACGEDSSSSGTSGDVLTEAPSADVETSSPAADAEAETGTAAEGTGEAAEPLLTSESLAESVSEARYAEDLLFVAVERAPGTPAWQAVQDHCADTFAAAGYEVERQAFPGGVNVIGVLPGQERPGEHVIVSGHYDHVAGCMGADDNASGTAGALEAARVLAKGRYARSLVVACWDQEELGLLGAKAYVARAVERGDDVVVSLVFEMIGYKDDAPDSQELPPGFDILFAEQTAQVEANERRGDFLALIADDLAHQPALDMMTQAEKDALEVVHIELTHAQTGQGMFHTLRRSDHDPFWQAGWGAIMITDTAEFRNKNYHCSAGPDSVERLDTGFASDIVRATVFAAANALELQ